MCNCLGNISNSYSFLTDKPYKLYSTHLGTAIMNNITEGMIMIFVIHLQAIQQQWFKLLQV